MPVEPPKVVLLVEDDALLRECLAEVLDDDGWQVIAVPQQLWTIWSWA